MNVIYCSYAFLQRAHFLLSMLFNRILLYNKNSQIALYISLGKVSSPWLQQLCR